MNVQRNGAVGFIDWLGDQSSMVWRSGLDRTLIRLRVHRPSRMGRNRKSSPKASTGAPTGQRTSIDVRHTFNVIQARRISRNGIIIKITVIIRVSESEMCLGQDLTPEVIKNLDWLGIDY
jgi:hypothetical protein